MNMLTSLEFGNGNGYQLSYVLIEYVVKQYGLDKLPAVVRDPNRLELVLGQNEQALHAGGLAYIARNYQ